MYSWSLAWMENIQKLTKLTKEVSSIPRVLNRRTEPLTAVSTGAASLPGGHPSKWMRLLGLLGGGGAGALPPPPRAIPSHAFNLQTVKCSLLSHFKPASLCVWVLVAAWLPAILLPSPQHPDFILVLALEECFQNSDGILPFPFNGCLYGKNVLLKMINKPTTLWPHLHVGLSTHALHSPRGPTTLNYLQAQSCTPLLASSEASKGTGLLLYVMTGFSPPLDWKLLSRKDQVFLACAFLTCLSA